MLDEAQRRGMLVAMGIDVYALRGSAENSPPFDACATHLVVACADSNAERGVVRCLREALPRALSVPAASIRWLTPADLESAPQASAYLLLGPQPPQTVIAELRARCHAGAVIAVADEPDSSMRSAIAKRALWQALKPIARRLSGAR